MNILPSGVPKQPAQQLIGFYLCEGFSSLPFISVIETMRIANRRSGEAFYQWVTISHDGKPVTACNGIEYAVDHKIDISLDCSILFFCGAYDARDNNDPSTISWCQALAKKDMILGGIDTGSYVLAKAGLLNGRSCTVHWESMADFKQMFPKLLVCDDVYVIDDDRITCCGGSASADMMLYLIEQTHGHELAAKVADSIIRPSIRTPDEPQRMGLQARLGVDNPILLECVELMEANIEEPLSPYELASLVNVSKRQLERLFQRYLHATPCRYYLGLRLAAAHRLLQSSNSQIVDIALACGFKSSGHFSTCYRSRYGKPPRADRR